MSKVFVLDTLHQVLDPVHPGYARKLLNEGKAAVFRRYPFTIILKREVEQPVTQPLRIKVDPVAKPLGLLLSTMQQERCYGVRNSCIEDKVSKRLLIRDGQSVAPEGNATRAIVSRVSTTDDAKTVGYRPLLKVG